MRAWRDAVDLPQPSCPVCDDNAADADGYAALLGYYLGDGCTSEAARYFVLRVSCDLIYPGIIDDVERCMRAACLETTSGRSC
ncbi:hypothetical protein [Nocardioides sp. SYSU DS0663]|uniref:hypothetical protein n=1 Tax=Nocardioides sp. SYSU DS0663 TaxID=3416445 RepID=UPI003F4C347C